MNTLWTKDYTIITIGSIVSMLGNSMATFAISLFVLDYTDTPTLYAVYLFLYTLPQIVAPVISGPFVDRFSRKKTIYMLDFLSASMFFFMGCMVMLGKFSFFTLAVITFINGVINSVYTVAFNSFYPMLITEGNFQKAYAISSTLEMVSYITIPLATFLYKSIGITPVLFLDAFSYLAAAVFETQVGYNEELHTQTYHLNTYIQDTKDGWNYLLSEKGILLISLYISLGCSVDSISTVVTLPWFRASFDNGEYLYMIVWGGMALGRALGGLLHYRFKIPAHWKYTVALSVYLITSFNEAVYLYTSLPVMFLLMFLLGILSVTSNNIRTSSTQSYVPSEIKGRYVGTFMMMLTVGQLFGQAVAGFMISIFPLRETLVVSRLLLMVFAILIIGRGKKYIEPIYNRNV
ncbi:MAG: MFS transporter [Erysipelotrichaceae bacterium]|nr:MFS transporter [Erysipelotrichaceae bacterium]